MANTLPIIHLNGTSREELVDQLREVSRHLRRAGDALAAATPNGRDYYPGGPKLFQAARSEHRRRQVQLSDLKREIDTMALNILDS